MNLFNDFRHGKDGKLMGLMGTLSCSLGNMLVSLVMIGNKSDHLQIAYQEISLEGS
jgi:hypothetical protein